MVERISVIIPTYYRNEELRKAIRSVKKQNYEDIEIIVVDSSGEGHAKVVAEDFIDVNYIEQSFDRGLQAARDEGLNNSNGMYVHFLDDDDRLLDGALIKKYEKITEDTDAGVVYSGLMWENGRIVLPNEDVRGDVIRHALALQMAPCLPSTQLIEASILKDIMPLENLPHDDAALKIELARRTKFDFVDEPLVYRGSLDDSRGASARDLQERRRTIEEYDSLYSEFPTLVKNIAISRTYLQEGQLYVNKNTWSLRGIISFGKACYYAPGFPVIYVAALLASLGGKYGWRFGFDLYSKIGDSRRGNIGRVDI